MGYWLGYFAVLVAGIASIVVIYKLLSKRAAASNIILSLAALFLSLMAVEFYFKVFFAQTDSYTFTLAARNWHEKYWQPVNSLGYRDREWAEQDIEGKTKIMVVGDSFVAGTGIENVEDRFANKLAALLGPDFVVFNVASPGWSTTDEIEGIITYPFQPDILVLSYFINDIESTAYSQGISRPQFVERPEGIMGFLVNNSYALNFVYWRWYRIARPPQNPTYLEWITSLYQDPDLWWRHRQELLTIIEGAATEQIPLYVVIFPDLAAAQESQGLLQPVIDLFNEHNIPVLNVTGFLIEQDPASIKVNAVDAHPNKQVNLEVAQQLYRMLQQQ